MLEVTSISASSYDPASLAPLLEEHARDGWEIISIVPAGTKVIAFLQRDAEAAAAEADPDATDRDAADADAGADDSSAVDEPAGWANAPEDDDAAERGVAEAAAAVAAAEVVTAAEPVPAEEVAVAEETAPVEPESTVPAGWYADPSGRFELRYWDGSGWTEHVSRAGQQYTDPPVA